MLAVVSCSPPQPKRYDDNSTARKAGHAAYGVVQDSKKLAKEAGQKLRQASRDARQGWKDAKSYFGELASSTNCPAALRAQAYYALGDTLVIIGQDSTNKVADYGEALTAFDQVAWLSPTNDMPVLALGGKAKCYLQAHDYGAASNAFVQVIESPRADIAARSGASVGLALALERMAEQTADTNQTVLLNLALTRCLDVFYFEKFLRPGESPDSYWTLKAGLEAARLADRLQLKDQSANLKRELNELFPVLQRKEELAPAKSPEAGPQSQN